MDIEKAVVDIQTPKYILALGEPVTHRWTDEKNIKQSKTYPVGAEFIVFYVFRQRRNNQKWADCKSPDGITMLIGHNKKHQLREIIDLPIDTPVE